MRSSPGHVHVGDDAILGGFTVVHQFCRIGAHSITGMGTIVLQDIPPYVKASGNPARPYGINAEGLRRRGFSAPAAITALKRAIQDALPLRASRSKKQSASCAAQAATGPEVRPLLEFVAAPGRGIIR